MSCTFVFRPGTAHPFFHGAEEILILRRIEPVIAGNKYPNIPIASSAQRSGSYIPRFQTLREQLRKAIEKLSLDYFSFHLRLSGMIDAHPFGRGVRDMGVFAVRLFDLTTSTQGKHRCESQKMPFVKAAGLPVEGPHRGIHCGCPSAGPSSRSCVNIWREKQNIQNRYITCQLIITCNVSYSGHKTVEIVQSVTLQCLCPGYIDRA